MKHAAQTAPHVSKSKRTTQRVIAVICALYAGGVVIGIIVPVIATLIR